MNNTGVIVGDGISRIFCDGYAEIETEENEESEESEE